ncbi:MAG: enoyl-CoA hydratase-related protein, partial [Syntrophales bacterium]
MTREYIRIVEEGRICRVILDRPEIKNGWDVPLVQELAAKLMIISGKPDIRVVVLEGSGKDFSSGADMNLFKDELPAPVWLDGMNEVGRMIRTVREIKQPVVAKVKGIAFGGGAGLALASDFVIAAHDARISVNFVNIGIVPDAGTTYFLPRLVGLVKAREIAMLGPVIDGRTAAAMGLIYKSVPLEDLDSEVTLLANNLAAKSVASTSLIKSALDWSFEKSLKEAVEWEASHQAVMTQREEIKEVGRQWEENMSVLDRYYTEEHKIFRESIRRFYEKEVTPQVDHWEKEGIVPKELWRKFGQQGFLCPWLPEEYGGAGADFLYSVIALEEQAPTHCSGFVTFLHSDIIVPYLYAYGNDEQKKQWLPGCVTGDMITAIAMTEPYTGSDLAGIRTTAVKDGDSYIINGQKTFISNGINCDLVIVAVKTDVKASPVYAGVSLIVVEDGAPGFEKGRKL